MRKPGRLRGNISGMVLCQILIRAAVIGRLRLLSSQCFGWAVLALKELVPLSRADNLELTVWEGIRPAKVAELPDLVLEEAAALVGRVQGRVVLVLGRVHVAFMDEFIRVLATWCQEHVLDAGSLSELWISAVIRPGIIFISGSAFISGASAVPDSVCEPAEQR